MNGTAVRRFLDRDLEPHFHGAHGHRHGWGNAPHTHKPGGGGMVYDPRFVKRKLCDVALILIACAALVIVANMVWGKPRPVEDNFPGWDKMPAPTAPAVPQRQPAPVRSV